MYSAYHSHDLKERLREDPYLTTRQLRKTRPEKQLKEYISDVYRPVHKLMKSASMEHLSDYHPEIGYKTYPLARTSSWSHSHPFAPTTHVIDDFPMRRYDLYHPMGWTYPIWKYIHRTKRCDTDHTIVHPSRGPIYYSSVSRPYEFERPSFYSPSRQYDVAGRSHHSSARDYTTPTRLDHRRYYPTYLAGERSFYDWEANNALEKLSWWRVKTAPPSPWYDDYRVRWRTPYTEPIKRTYLKAIWI